MSDGADGIVLPVCLNFGFGRGGAVRKLIGAVKRAIATKEAAVTVLFTIAEWEEVSDSKSP